MLLLDAIPWHFMPCRGASVALEGRVRARAAVEKAGASGMDDILMLMSDVGLASKGRVSGPSG